MFQVVVTHALQLVFPNASATRYGLKAMTYCSRAGGVRDVVRIAVNVHDLESGRGLGLVDLLAPGGMCGGRWSVVGKRVRCRVPAEPG